MLPSLHRQLLPLAPLFLFLSQSLGPRFSGRSMEMSVDENPESLRTETAFSTPLRVE